MAPGFDRRHLDYPHLDDPDRFALDTLNAPGGGHSSSVFPTMASHSSAHPSLPSQPANYEDFEFSSQLSSFDFDFFPSTHLSFGGPENPFSPTGYTPASPPLFDPRTPPILPSTSSHRPTAAAPTTDGPPAALFDDSESALFSSFLNTLDGDQTFLFNPVLPPNMPSPPPALLRHEDERERDVLGNHVSALSLGFSHAEPAIRVKREDDDDAAALGPGHFALSDFHPPPSVSQLPPLSASASVSVSALAELDDPPDTQNGTKTRAGGLLQPGRVGKKIKTGTGSSDDDVDVEMAEPGPAAAGSEDDESSTTAATATGGAPASRRRVGRSSISGGTRPAVRRPSKARQRASSTASKPVLPPPAPAPPAAPAAETSRSRSATPSNDEDEDPGSPVDRKVPLTDSQKRSNHILSEQKRRNAIRCGFKDLVDLLANGEQASGIVVAPSASAVGEGEEGEGGGRKKKGKGSGRGRGRKGEVGAGASKSVVLEKAAAYIRWLERGNEGLEEEVRRVEMTLARS